MGGSDCLFPSGVAGEFPERRRIPRVRRGEAVSYRIASKFIVVLATLEVRKSWVLANGVGVAL